MSQRAILFLLSLLLALPLQAQERILAYDSTVTIQADGDIDVEERIRVRAEGIQIRRGIYRDFPTRYRDRYGNRMVVGFEVQEVLRDGQPEPWFTENISNGVRLNTGNDDFLALPAEYTYTLRYRTSRQIGFFSDHDELYWNAIGTGWLFTIESGAVEVLLPQTVPMAQLQAEGYTGPQGTQGQNFNATISAPGQAHWQLTQPLPPAHGLTIVLSFPKGIVTAPSKAQRTASFFKDNGGVLIALVGLLLMLGYALQRWRAVGRDPKPGIIIARYNPPPEYSPAALRYIARMGPDIRCTTSDLLSLAVAGLVTIERKKGLLKDEWSLQRTPGAVGDNLSPSQRALLDGLFGASETVTLSQKNHSVLQRAMLGQYKVLEKAYANRMFHRNYGSVGIAFLIGAVAIVLALKIAAGSGIVPIIAITLAMLVVLVGFGLLVRAPTPAGRKLLDEVEGLKLYLGVAEREDIARLHGPDQAPELDAERYQQLLPYAVALDVEEAWTGKFTLAVGAAAAAAATAGIAWYRGGSFSDMNQLSSAIGKSLSSQIASASSPPGSSSGSGGGGSSGGGGGGGGGGGR